MGRLETGSPTRAGRLRLWLLAARPFTLSAAVAPVIAATGVAAAEGRIRWPQAVMALVVGILLQVGVNYANDYSDHRRGADRERRGPFRLAASGLVEPKRVRGAALLTLGAAATVGTVLSLTTDPRLLLAGAAAIAAAWLYTGGPRPYGYVGLGEVFVFLFFGLMAGLGTEYVEIGRVTRLGLLAAIAMGAWSCAILMLNNLRDLESDQRAGKLTLAVRLGRARSRQVLLGFYALAGACALLAGSTPHPWAAVALLALTAVPGSFRRSASADPGHLVRALQRTAAGQVFYSLLFGLGSLAA